MKDVRTQIAIGLLLISSALCMGQQPTTASGVISISVETGQAASKPGCNPRVDGCPLDSWITKREFKTGDKVWLRITVVNQSDQFLATDYLPELPMFGLVVKNTTANRLAKPTRLGCWLMQDECPLADNDPIRGEVELMAPMHRWLIPPRTSTSRTEEINREFDLREPGVYSLSASANDFF